jgi:hypothetical protein
MEHHPAPAIIAPDAEATAARGTAATRAAPRRPQPNDKKSSEIMFGPAFPAGRARRFRSRRLLDAFVGAHLFQRTYLLQAIAPAAAADKMLRAQNPPV